MLEKHHQQLYDAFYQSSHDSEHLDPKTETLVGLAAAMALNCEPCTHYYLKRAKAVGISRGELSDVLAKVMAVAAGQKRLQTQDVLEKYQIDLDAFPR